LVFLTGGPGQPGVLFATLVASQLLDPAVLRDYRLVLIDQRGTGGGALQCPELQRLSDAAVFPYDRSAAAANGIAVTCEQWPSTPVVPFLAGQDLPAVPVLLLAGDHDLPTPLLWAQQEAPALYGATSSSSPAPATRPSQATTVRWVAQPSRLS
jgi:pimeloyl-ACP methyl ester carboxylesterase